MLGEIRGILHELSRVFCIYDDILKGVTTREYSLPQLFRSDLGSYLFYIAGADGTITDAECDFIAAILDWRLTPAQMATLVEEKDIYGEKFGQRVPESLIYAVKMDKKYNNSIYSNNITKNIISIFDAIGRLMLIADSEATEDEFKAYDRYMKTMVYYVEDQFKKNVTPGNIIYIENMIRVDLPDDPGYGDGGLGLEAELREPTEEEIHQEAENRRLMDKLEAALAGDGYAEDEEILGEVFETPAPSKAEPKAETVSTPLPQTFPLREDMSFEEIFESFWPSGIKDKPKKQPDSKKKYSEPVDDKPLVPQKEYKATQVKDKNKPEETLQELLGELDSLLGLENVKEDVRSLINLVNIMKLREKKGMKRIPVSLHLVFSGNPGTGKTTVARLLAKLYHKIGVLSRGHLVEVDRSGLVAGYVGQTAIKTQEVIKKAMGGVLFIDEAYALVNGAGEQDYGREAIDTILKAMEDNREDFVVIVAGYPKLMETFVNANPGLKSRFNKFLNFADYTPDELTGIFVKLCKDNQYVPTKDALEFVHVYLTDKFENRDENFANGRTVRNFFEKVMTKQANRLALIARPTEKQLSELTLEDVAEVE